MKKAIDIFNTTVSKLDERIKTLQNEVSSLEADKKSAEENYRQMMVDDSTGVKEYTTEQLNKPKQRVDELNSQIQTAKERINMLEKAATEKKAELVPAVQQAYREESGKLTAEIDVEFLKVRELRAKLTLSLLGANEKYRAAHQLRTELNDVERAAGVDQTHRLYVPEHIPTGGGAYTPYDAGIVPTEDELRDVYLQGKLNLWVQHYAETGEVATHEVLRDRLRTQSESTDEKETSNLGLLQTVAQGAKGLVDKVLGKN
jgi:predicted  nucleic acid-binding Zn-ribbon protein